MHDENLDIETIRELFDFRVTSGGNFSVNSAIENVIPEEYRTSFFNEIYMKYPDIAQEFTLDYEGNDAVLGITPLGLVKLVMVLPTNYTADENARKFVENVRSNIPALALESAVLHADAESLGDEEETLCDEAFGLDGDEPELPDYIADSHGDFSSPCEPNDDEVIIFVIG